jgi:hypothetical protein
MIVAMRLTGTVQVTIDKIVGMIAMGNGLVSA